MAIREKPQKSFQVLMKQNDGSQLPNDLGLLEGIHHCFLHASLSEDNS